MDKQNSNVNREISIISILFLLFFCSRIVVINSKDVFFDSGEYLQLFSNPNLLEAIVRGHAPPHEGYLLLFWPVFQIGELFHAGSYSVIVGQIVLACLTIFCFYQIVNSLVDRRTALIASVIASLLPLFWITNATIMMENAYIFFFFASLYLLVCFLNTTKSYQLHFSLLLFAIAFLTHPMIILWLPLYLSFVFFTKRDLLKTVFISLVFYLSIFISLNILFLSSMLSMDIPTTIHYVYLSKGGEFASLGFDIKSFLIIMRNFLIPLLRNNTIIIVILSGVSLIMLLANNKKLFIIGLLWITPALYANQWWDSLLNGRHAVVAGFGFAFLVAYCIRKNSIVVFAVIAYLTFVSFPIVALLKQPIPYITEAEFIKSLPKGNLFIESHFARPQVQEISSSEFFFVNEPGFDKNLLSQKINNYLANKKQIFVSSAALSEPYGLYSGPYVHNITLSYAKPFELESVITQYELKVYKAINRKDNLIIYQIASHKPSPYPNVPSLKNSCRRLDYYDPLWRVSSYILENKWRK